MNGMAKELLKALQHKKWSIATAESCTGGMIASEIVNVPGASETFKGGIVSYADEAKIKMLGVPELLLNSFGAVSAECVGAMLDGAQIALNSECAIATSGVAGPDGGSADKPVGLVYVGALSPDKKMVIRCMFTGDRLEIRQQATRRAIELMLNILI